MKKTILGLCVVFCYLTNFAQQTGTFTDPRDNRVYKTVTIGTQTMMAENLAFNPSKGNYWGYDDNQTNICKCGYLYTWETAQDIAPNGWHLPTKDEWKILYDFLGKDDLTVYKAIIEGGFSGFNAMLGGYRVKNGEFYIIGPYGDFWSPVAHNENQSWFFNCFAYNGRAYVGNLYSRTCGFSVRLFKD